MPPGMREVCGTGGQCIKRWNRHRHPFNVPLMDTSGSSSHSSGNDGWAENVSSGSLKKTSQQSITRSAYIILRNPRTTVTHEEMGEEDAMERRQAGLCKCQDKLDDYLCMGIPMYVLMEYTAVW